MTKYSQIIQAVGTFFIGISLLIAVVAGVTSWKNGFQPRTLSVTGKATRAIAPDQSVISGSWEKRANTSEQAREETKAEASKGVEALRESGVDEKDIITTRVAVYPEYDYSIISQRGNPKIDGYRAVTSLQVTLDNPEKADEIIGLMTKNGASSTEGPSLGFTTSTRDELAKQLKQEAIIDAQSQAKAMSSQLGARLGKVISVHGGDLNDPGQPIPFAARSLEMSTSDVSSRDIAIGEKEISITINVVYQVK